MSNRIITNSLIILHIFFAAFKYFRNLRLSLLGKEKYTIAFSYRQHSTTHKLILINSPHASEKRSNWKLFAEEGRWITDALTYCLFLGHANSALNPIVYCFMTRNFRRSVSEILRRSFHGLSRRKPRRKVSTSYILRCTRGVSV